MMVGTSADQVQRWSVSHGQKERTRNRWGMTTEPPVSSVGISVTFSALMWYSGSTHRLRSRSERSWARMEFQAPASTLSWEKIAPLGRPVLPDV